MRTLRQRFTLSLAAFLSALAVASTASAQLTIVRNFGGGAPPGNLVGGGDLQTIFNAACDYWERTICMDPHTVTITYRWGAQGGSTLASHTLLSQGGIPNRETSGRIIFDNDGSSVFFADPTPFANSEYNNAAEVSNDFGGGPMNIGRLWNQPNTSASSRTDLLTVAMHEVGHALGMSSANFSWAPETGDDDIDVKAPLPFTGAAIPTDPGSAHLNVSRSLMYFAIGTGIRKIQADTDIVGNAEISNFTQVLVGNPAAASSSVRNGSGVNPTGFAEVTTAVIGTNWQTTVALAGASGSLVFAGLGGPAAGTPTAYGELLVNPPLQTGSIAGGAHSISIPYDCAFVGLTIPTQAATYGPIKLQNALDITIGAY